MEALGPEHHALPQVVPHAAVVVEHRSEPAEEMLRKTQQREAIRRALVAAGRPLSPQEIADAAQADAPGVGLATVYRTVKRFSEEGWLVAIALPGESPRYELSGKTHHHHFRCE